MCQWGCIREAIRGGISLASPGYLGHVDTEVLISLQNCICCCTLTYCHSFLAGGRIEDVQRLPSLRRSLVIPHSHSRHRRSLWPLRPSSRRCNQDGLRLCCAPCFPFAGLVSEFPGYVHFLSSAFFPVIFLCVFLMGWM